MNEQIDRSRRSLLRAGPVTGFALAIPALLGQKNKEQDQEEVTPAEDLMLEHGLLKRILRRSSVHSSSSITRSWRKTTSFPASVNTACLWIW